MIFQTSKAQQDSYLIFKTLWWTILSLKLFIVKLQPISNLAGILWIRFQSLSFWLHSHFTLHMEFTTLSYRHLFLITTKYQTIAHLYLGLFSFKR